MAISVEVKNGQLHIRDGEKLYRLNPESIGAQIKLTAQNGVEQADVQAELEAIHTKIEAVDALAKRTSWRGSVNSDSEIPTTYEAGDRWVVATPGVYKGQTLETGEIIVAIVSRQGSGNDNSDFTFAQYNLNGVVTGPASAADGNLMAFDGASGTVAKDSGVALSDVSDAVTKRHQHANAALLDGISADGETVTINGKTFYAGRPVAIIEAGGEIPADMSPTGIVFEKVAAGPAA